MVPRGRRFLALILILPVYTALVMCVISTMYEVLMDPAAGWGLMLDRILKFGPAGIIGELGEPETIAVVVIPALGLVASQVMFLLPLLHRRPLSDGGRRSLLASMISAGLVAAVLSASLLFMLVGAIKLAGGARVEFESDFWVIVAVLVGAICLLWIAWTAAFWSFTSSGTRRPRLKRLMGLLLGGTIAELVLLMPMDVMVRRKTDCYCATPTYWSICMSLWALLWLTGPGAVLLLTRKHRHRLWSGKHCLRCGYEKGPSPGEQCPECGFAWKFTS